tara:strand:+ start:171 stop:1166 length:996 start_codon:yes stop_codon:yes gene_type:complete
MSILDNSGDIILDCVLTETGRKRLSTGQFSISKFALGDDEIDYGLYQKNHASGSAYYDLQILQTPVLEAFTARNAAINYGLISVSNNNLLYMPSIKRNLKIPGKSVFDKHNVIYLAVNDGVTYTTLITLFGGAAGGGANYVLQAGSTSGGQAIMLESGLDTSAISATPSNKQNYLVSQGLQETTFSISVDNRFIATVLGPGSDSIFNNNGASGEANVKFNLAAQALVSADTSVRNHSLAAIRAVNNNVYFRTTDATLDTATSAIAGPRGAATAFSLDTRPITSDSFTRFGVTGRTLTGDGSGNTYSYIDSVVYVRGTYCEHQLTVRIIKKD